MSNIDLSVAIPCFNESQNIKIVLDQLKTISNEVAFNLEVVVIDGGSTDETPSELKKIFKNLPSDKFKLILKNQRGGYGNDIMEAVGACQGKVLSWTHADLQTDPIDIIRAYELFLSCKRQNLHQVFIKGERKNRRLIEAFFSFGMQIISWFALKVYLSDINAQPKLFSRDFYQDHLKMGHPNDFSLDLYALYQAKTNGYQIKTLPVFFKKRIHGEAKGGGGGWKMRINLIKRTFKYIFKLKNQVSAS